MRRIHLSAFLAVLTASLACSIFVGGPELPSIPPPPPGETQPDLDAQVERAVQDSVTTGTVSLQFTQEQLTAYIASSLAKQDPPLLTDVQAVFGDQEMTIYGRGRSGMLEANVAVTTEFDVDSEGLPQVRITDAQLGPLEMPQALQDAIAAAFDEALTGYVGPAAIGFRLESIDISDGMMTVTGRLR